MASETSSDDNLSLADKPQVQKMISKLGDKSEKVLFSDFVIKINKREKEQTRVMLITNLAVYNLKPSDYGSCKRRIPVDFIISVTASNISDEFVLHVPDEYDYRFKSGKKNKIASILKQAFADIIAIKQKKGHTVEQTKLGVSFVSQSDLKDIVMTKDDAKLQTREDRFKRRQQLTSDGHESDDEEEKNVKEAESKEEVTKLLDTKERVRLEDFELLKVLGRGSFGKVMQVKKKSDGKVYAMKILKKKAIVARNQVEHTKAERKILESLQHPFLMTLRYAFQTPEKLYFVLDYFPGGELFFHLKAKRRFQEDVARLQVAEVAAALGHLHSLNVIYRDLKPENILLDESGHCCLTDFGLSKDVDPNDQAHTFCGTPEYLAPEIVVGSGHGKAVDWWSLGILLYELTVGIPPFYSQNVNEMYNKIQHGVLRFPPFLSEDCKNMIIALLQRDPMKRLGSKNDIEDLKAMPFFAVLKWDKLLRKEIIPEYTPRTQGKADTSNFDDTFTAEPVVDTYVAPSTMKEGDKDDSFGNFTYQQQSNID